MEFLETNPNTFQPLVAALDPPRSFEDYIKGIKQNSVWGTTVEIIAAATCFK